MTTENKRIYEIAKELGLTTKEIMEKLDKDLGIKVKSHSSVLTEEQVAMFKNSLKEASAKPAVKKPKAFIVKKSKEEKSQNQSETGGSATVSKASHSQTVSKVIAENRAMLRAVEKQPENKKTKADTADNTVPTSEPVQNTASVNRPEMPSIRSLLDYNNKNSQKFRAEKLAQIKRENREKERAKLLTGTKPGEKKPSDIKKSETVKDFGKSRQPSGKISEKKPFKPGENTAVRPGVKRHIITPDMYENKPSFGKRKNAPSSAAKAKANRNKSKEEQQELISLEKAMAQKHRKKERSAETVDEVKSVIINSVITVGELATKINKSPAEVVKFLMLEGILATVNQVINIETQKKVCEHFEIEVKEEDLDAFIEEEIEKEEHKKITKIQDENLKSRAPVVSILGHVDHGKTTLLDAIREEKHKITADEVGGITQSIGAYTVHTDNGKIVFIDTPGHEAFTEMRARGAKATDIAILVVAADDGIMPQTIEAINHARAAEVPIIVAVNKIDKPAANPDKVLQQLTEHGLVPEEWGGDTICVKVSALQKTGINELLDYILLVAEVQNYRADSKAPAAGVVIEANLDKGKGPVATLLVQNGTLKTGDCIVVGNVGGRVRALIADNGERIKKAGPSTPVEILGLGEVPQSGDFFEVVANEKEMKRIIEERKEKERTSRLEAMMPSHIRNDAVGENNDEIKRLNIIIKANTHGAAEAVSQAVSGLESKEIITKIIHVGVGDISEADVMLASAGNAVILGFTVKEDANALASAEKYNVTIKKYDIIYQVLEDLEKTMINLLEPEIKEVELGKAEVRQIFTVGKTNKIAGCYVTEGKVVRNKIAILERGGVEIFKGTIDQLKRFKDDVKEVAQGFECGISFAKFNDIEEGDIIRVLTTEEVERQVLV